MCFKSCLHFLGDSSFLPTELNCKGTFLVGASEKQNMLCTEDESMIKNVSRGGGAGEGEGEGSRGLKGKLRGNQSSRTKFNGGPWKVSFVIYSVVVNYSPQWRKLAVDI